MENLSLNESSKKKINIIKLIFIIMFSIIISIFPILWISGVSAGKNYEKKVLANAPKLKNMFLEYPTFAGDFEKYYNDTFPFKSKIISLYSLIEYKFFNSSILPSVTSVGKNGWLFYENYGTRNAISGNRMFTPGELEYIYNGIMKKYETLKSMNKEYIVYIAPEKQTIYPEYDLLSKSKYTSIDQLLEYLAQKECPVSVLYGKDFLLSKKEKNKNIYYKYDTHWNKLGSYYGYLDVMSQVKKLLPDNNILIAESYETTTYKYSGDLAGTLFLSNYLSETSPQLNFSYKPTFSNENGVTLINSSTPSDLKVFIYGDSFAQATYWSASFAQSAKEVRILHNKNTFKKLLDNIGDSDIVIEECVQRVPTTLGKCILEEPST